MYPSQSKRPLPVSAAPLWWLHPFRFMAVPMLAMSFSAYLLPEADFQEQLAHGKGVRPRRPRALRCRRGRTYRRLVCLGGRCARGILASHEAVRPLPAGRATHNVAAAALLQSNGILLSMSPANNEPERHLP